MDAGAAKLICNHCNRRIAKPSATKRISIAGMVIVKVYGPVCAVKLGLTQPKPKRMNISLTYRGMSKRIKAFWQAQRDLFEDVAT